jgi:hypothetical protein
MQSAGKVTDHGVREAEARDWHYRFLLLSDGECRSVAFVLAEGLALADGRMMLAATTTDQDRLP